MGIQNPFIWFYPKKYLACFIDDIIVRAKGNLGIEQCYGFHRKKDVQDWEKGIKGSLSRRELKQKLIFLKLSLSTENVDLQRNQMVRIRMHGSKGTGPKLLVLVMITLIVKHLTPLATKLGFPLMSLESLYTRWTP